MFRLKTIWLTDHICSVLSSSCLFLGFKFYYPGAFAPNRIFFRCLEINPPLLFIPHKSHNPPSVTSQSATCGDDYNVMNKGL